MEFRELDEETELTVTQQGFTNELARTEDRIGWEGCLDRLGGLVSKEIL